MPMTVLPGTGMFKNQMNLVRAHASNMEPAMFQIMASFHRIEQERFDNEGPAWEPLKDSTIIARGYLGYDAGPILQRDGVLMESFTGGGFSTNAFGPNFMEVISHVEYAGYHQYGMGRNPVRKIIDITPNALLLWREILQIYLATGVTGNISDDAIAMAL